MATPFEGGHCYIETGQADAVTELLCSLLFGV